MARRFLVKNWPLVVLLVLFNLLLGALLLWNWEQLRFGAYDLGIHDQVLYHYSRTSFIPSSFTHFPAPFWDSHFRPTFIIFFLQYLIWPSPQLFIVLQAVLFSLGVVPLYLLAVERLGSRLIGLAFSFAYLFYPGALSALAFPGHSENLVVTLVSWALFFYLRQDKKRFLTLFLLAAVSQENISLYLSGLSLFLFVKGDKKLALTCFLLSASYGLVMLRYLIPWRLGQAYVPSQRYFDNLTGLAPIFVSPEIKLKTVLLSLFNFGFLPLGTPTLLLAPVISLLVRFLSVRKVLWGLFYHYSVFLTPFLAYAALISLDQLGQKWRLLKKRVVILAISFSFFVFPILINSHFGYFENNFTKFTRLSVEDKARIRHLLAQIPEYASVSAQDRVIPLLTHRERVYIFRDYHLAEYIPIDLALNFSPLTKQDGVLFTHQLLDSDEYEIVECTSRSVLFRKAYQPEPKKKCPEFEKNLDRL